MLPNADVRCPNAEDCCPKAGAFWPRADDVPKVELVLAAWPKAGLPKADDGFADCPKAGFPKPEPGAVAWANAGAPKAAFAAFGPVGADGLPNALAEPKVDDDCELFCDVGPWEGLLPFALHISMRFGCCFSPEIRYFTAPSRSLTAVRICCSALVTRVWAS